MDLSSFIPIDRRWSLARGLALPEQATGAALFADLSGFTALTEAFTQAFGPQRGAEEMTALLNQILAALIEQVHAYRGSVVGFSGDAITCWFAGDTGLRAATAALALQATLAQFAARPLPFEPPQGLALKCAVAAGEARRFLVGNPATQLLDILAGPPITRIGVLEDYAERGEILLDAGVHHALRVAGPRGAWRTFSPGDRVFVLVALARPACLDFWPPFDANTLSDAQIQPWLLPAVWNRLRHSASEFLTELRPAVVLFARFTGIDYTRATVRRWLDAYLAWVQGVLGRYDGALLQLTVGDKGSYFYAAFGAPIAHDDDTARAVAAAAMLIKPPSELSFIRSTQIGLAAGPVRAGTYGGPSRQTYGALGDAVNLGARLMQSAEPGQVLAMYDIGQAAGPRFRWASLPPLALKGKAQLVPVCQLVAEPAEHHVNQLELVQRGPLIGRAAERAQLEQLLYAARRGTGRVAAISGEAGQGKSRLVAEAVRIAQSAGFVVYGGAAQSSGQQSPYLAWRPIWRALFGLPAQPDLAVDMPPLADSLRAIEPKLLLRLALLGPLLGLALPETHLTSEMDAALRAASLEALLIDCVRAFAAPQPLLLVLEDCHWLDPPSLDLLATIARAIAEHPIVLLLAYRPDTQMARQLRRVERLPHSLLLHLGAFAEPEARALVRARLGSAGSPPEALVRQIIARAEGNPFFLEELTAYLAEHGDWPGKAVAGQLDLPTSLQRLLLARIDRLSEPSRLVLKLASVIGRRFTKAQLWGVYPLLGGDDPVAGELAALDRQELILLEHHEPEQIYLFKHQVTQEVAYASLPQHVRARLHEQFAAWLETTSAANAQPLDLLAYHYGQSDNLPKQRHYYRLAGDTAAASYANAIAAEYYARLLALEGPAEQPATLIALGQALMRDGKLEPAAERYSQAIGQALAAAEQAAALAGLGRVRRMQGALAEAETHLTQAHGLYAGLAAGAGMVETLQELARVHRLQGRYAQCGAAAAESETLARAANNLLGIARARSILGRAALDQGEYTRAYTAFEQALSLFRMLGDQPEIAHALLALAQVVDVQGNLAQARTLVEECLALSRRLGDRPGVVYALGSLGLIALNRGEYAIARARAEESLALVRELGDQHGLVVASTNLGLVALSAGHWAEARAHYHRTLQLALELGYQSQIAIALVGLAASSIGGAHEAAQLARALGWLGAALHFLGSMGLVLERLERDVFEHALATARTVLPEPAFQAAWAAGQALEWQQASADAIAASQE